MDMGMGGDVLVEKMNREVEEAFWAKHRPTRLDDPEVEWGLRECPAPDRASPAALIDEADCAAETRQDYCERRWSHDGDGLPSIVLVDERGEELETIDRETIGWLWTPR